MHSRPLTRHYNVALSRILTRTRIPSQNAVPYEQVCSAVHDMRNPISSILVLSELLSTFAPGQLDEGKVRQHAALIHKLAGQLHAITQDLLPPPAARSGRRLERVPVSELLSEAFALCEPIAHDRAIHLELADESQGARLACDRNDIHRVFSNLIGNAIKYSPPGTRVRISCSAAERSVQFSVTDEGRGIPAEQLERVFDRYWRCAPRQSGGSGIGLAISREIVSRHGGRIWAENRTDGPGSVFRFTLPASCSPHGATKSD